MGEVKMSNPIKYIEGVEYPVGTVLDTDIGLVEVKEGDGCDGCAFRKTTFCSSDALCRSSERNDRESVIFTLRLTDKKENNYWRNKYNELKQKLAEIIKEGE